ncbi:hypothetical protein C8Q70DRAFT_1096247 [Cubamyces menziesii]|nr:hypothetical protein C8Q70DRAFT_1096247 [Cubamyces menziesii]
MSASVPLPAVLIEEIGRTRLLPEQYGQGNGTRIVPLSILDNTVVRFALTSAVWYFNNPGGESDALSTELLASSLQKTLNAYPQWAGQLHWMPYDGLDGEQRQGRVCISYGSPSDPGLELIFARSPRNLSSLVPDSMARMERGAWCADDLPSAQLLCTTSLALHSSSEYAGKPCISVQVTTFACGGLSIALRLVHCIADAIAMFQFVKDWAATHRALLQRRPLPTLTPVFDPALLDGAATGCVKGETVDPEILKISRSLPMAKFDWWASAPGCPEPMLSATAVPPELEGTDLGPPGDPMPWAEWDVFAPVSHYLLYFTPTEVERIWEEASSAGGFEGSRVSRLDALLAFVWRLIIRARGMERDPELVHMFVTIGARTRLAPPLPNTFLGSPIVLARVSLPAEQVASSGPSTDCGVGARAIRSAVSCFSPAALGAYLHDAAHEVNPQRFWRAFLGRRHSIVTSWQNLDAYGIDFGSGAPPRYVDAVMPSMDGCIHVMEAGPLSVRRGSTETPGRWYDSPVCVSLHLAAEVMAKLVRDAVYRPCGYARVIGVNCTSVVDSPTKSESGLYGAVSVYCLATPSQGEVLNPPASR